MLQSREEQKPQNLILEGRRKLAVSGVVSIENCDEAQAIIQTSLGELVIQGSNIHITQTNLEIGELSLCGDIKSFKYNKEKTKFGKMVNKMLK